MSVVPFLIVTLGGTGVALLLRSAPRVMAMVGATTLVLAYVCAWLIRPDEILLHAGQVERRTIAGLAARAVVGQAGLVPDDQHRHVGLPRDGNRLCEVVARVPVDRASPRVPHPRPEPRP